MYLITKVVAYRIARRSFDRDGRLIDVPLEGEPVYETEQAAEIRAKEIIAESVDAERAAKPKPQRRGKATGTQRKKLSLAMTWGDNE